MTNEEIRKEIQTVIDDRGIVLFMKGTPEEPSCGFSSKVVQCLNDVGYGYDTVNILPDPRIREELSAISDWPTIPQLFVRGKLVGGCDIVVEMHENGELAELVGSSDKPKD